jgi:hypothetical protein
LTERGSSLVLRLGRFLVLAQQLVEELLAVHHAAALRRFDAKGDVALEFRQAVRARAWSRWWRSRRASRTTSLAEVDIPLSTFSLTSRSGSRERETFINGAKALPCGSLP